MTGNRLANGRTHGITVRPGDGTAVLSGNTVRNLRGDGYHFEDGSRGIVTLDDSVFRGVRGDELFIGAGAAVDVVPPAE